MFAQVILDIAHQNVDKIFEYRIPEGMHIVPGMRAALPFGRSKQLKEGFVVGVSATSAIEEARIRELVRPLDAEPVVIAELMELSRWMQKRYHNRYIDGLRLMIPAQLRGDRVKVKTQWLARRSVEGEALEAALRALDARAPKQAESLRALATEWSPIPSEQTQYIKLLEQKGYAERKQAEQLRTPYKGIRADYIEGPSLREQQSKAARAVEAALDSGRLHKFLLHGVTGSGKTEVYIQAIRKCLEMERSAILLVPEIALTPQMVNWFRGRFGDRAAVLHSRLSPGERYDEWRRIRRGDADLVIGARSAIFAPFDNVGLIIVDEEHESTYVSDNAPRYDAREVAAWRAQRNGGVLVLGSATPSLATFQSALAGEYELLEMRERVNERPLPEVTIVDMRAELTRGNNSIFSAELLRRLEITLLRGEQALLFINRRGFHTFVSCRVCGTRLHCAHCDVSLTYHDVGQYLKCHYCDTRQPLPRQCPECGSESIRYFGAGTQMVEREVKKRFPTVQVLRADNDTTRTKDAHEQLFEGFRRGDAQVLVGTQMIAKGLDFPNVTLVGVVAADASLNLPDYRSEERTYQLLTQVAGRAGRGKLKGSVVVQTYQPEHYAIVMAAKQEYRAFYMEEMGRRRKGLLPPYTMLVRALVTSLDPEAAKAEAERIERDMRAFLEGNRRLTRQLVQMRAMEAPVGKIADMARWQVFLKLYADAASEEVIEALTQCTTDHPTSCTCQVEVNPATLV